MKRKKGIRELWVIEVRNSEYDWDASIPAYLTQKEAEEEARKWRDLKAPKFQAEHEYQVKIYSSS